MACSIFGLRAQRYLFIYGTIKLQNEERWQSENFIGKLHLKKQIKIELIELRKHEFIS